MDGGPFYHKLCLPITIVQLQLLKLQNYHNKYDCNCRYNSGGLGVSEYGFSMRGNTLGVSTHREPFSYMPWGFREHGGFLASYTGTGNQGKPGKWEGIFQSGKGQGILSRLEKSGNFTQNTGKIRKNYTGKRLLEKSGKFVSKKW